MINIIKKEIDVKNIILQKEEVSEIKWVSKKELNELININKIIPHKKDFEILNNILKD